MRQRKKERELSFRSYTNCKWYKRLASHFTVHSSSTVVHNWNSPRWQHCFVNAVLFNIECSIMTTRNDAKVNVKIHGHKEFLCPTLVRQTTHYPRRPLAVMSSWSPFLATMQTCRDLRDPSSLSTHMVHQSLAADDLRTWTTPQRGYVFRTAFCRWAAASL